MGQLDPYVLSRRVYVFVQNPSDSVVSVKFSSFLEVHGPSKGPSGASHVTHACMLLSEF